MDGLKWDVGPDPQLCSSKDRSPATASIRVGENVQLGEETDLHSFSSCSHVSQ